MGVTGLRKRRISRSPISWLSSKVRERVDDEQRGVSSTQVLHLRLRKPDVHLKRWTTPLLNESSPGGRIANPLAMDSMSFSLGSEPSAHLSIILHTATCSPAELWCSSCTCQLAVQRCHSHPADLKIAVSQDSGELAELKGHLRLLSFTGFRNRRDGHIVFSPALPLLSGPRSRHGAGV